MKKLTIKAEGLYLFKIETNQNHLIMSHSDVKAGV